MPNPDAVLTINFNLKVDTATDAKLIYLAGHRHESKAATIRSLIRNAYAMSNERTPMCATGAACLCPHVHTYAPRTPLADAEAARTAGD